MTCNSKILVTLWSSAILCSAVPNLSPDVFAIRILLISFPTWYTQKKNQGFALSLTAYSN